MNARLAGKILVYYFPIINIKLKQRIIKLSSIPEKSSFPEKFIDIFYSDSETMTVRSKKIFTQPYFKALIISFFMIR